MLDYIVKQPKSEQIMAAYMNVIFLRPDILKGLTELLTESCIKTTEDKDLRDRASVFALELVKNKQIKEGVL